MFQKQYKLGIAFKLKCEQIRESRFVSFFSYDECIIATSYVVSFMALHLSSWRLTNLAQKSYPLGWIGKQMEFDLGVISNIPSTKK